MMSGATLINGGDPPPVTLWRAIVFAVIVAALVFTTSYRLGRGVGPDSLWLDDTWVAALVMHASTADLVAIAPPVPIGFVMLQKAVTGVFGEGEAQLQALPIFFGLASIPFIGWIAWRATGSLWLGVLAAALLAGGRTQLVYTLRVKQFTLEGIITLLLIALAMRCVRRPGVAAFTLATAAAAMCLPFSFTAAPVGLVIVNILSLHLALNRVDISRAALFSVCAGYNSLILLWLLLLPRHANDAMFDFWADHYLPLHDPTAMWPFVQTRLSDFIAGALPTSLTWFALGVPLAIILLGLRRSTRLLALALLLFYGGMLSASWLGLYPLGGGRTDVFSYPVTVLAVVAACWAMSRRVRFAPHLALTVVALSMLLYFPDKPIDYPKSDGRDTVESVQKKIQDADALILSPMSSWAFGVYDPAPVELVPTEGLSNGFIVVPQRPGTLVLHESRADHHREQQAAVAAQIDAFLEERPPRVVYVSIHFWSLSDDWVAARIQRLGYALRETPQPVGSRLMVFERVPQSRR